MPEKTAVAEIEDLQVEASWDVILEMHSHVSSTCPSCCSCFSCSGPPDPDIEAEDEPW